MAKIKKIWDQVSGNTRIGSEDFSLDGFEILTEDDKIIVGIDGSGQCCEDFGCFIHYHEHIMLCGNYFQNPDQYPFFDDLVGADIFSFKVIEAPQSIEEYIAASVKGVSGIDQSNLMCVEFLTDKGVFYITAYNDRGSGYYGHEAAVVSKTLKHNENL